MQRASLVDGLIVHLPRSKAYSSVLQTYAHFCKSSVEIIGNGNFHKNFYSTISCGGFIISWRVVVCNFPFLLGVFLNLGCILHSRQIPIAIHITTARGIKIGNKGLITSLPIVSVISFIPPPAVSMMVFGITSNPFFIFSTNS